MKKFVFLSVLVLICGSAFAVTRNGQKVPTVTTLEGGYEVIGNGSATVTTAGTPVQLSTTSTKTAKVTMCASADNTGLIAVGGANVSAAGNARSGVTLSAGDCLTLACDDLSSVYVDSTVSSSVSRDSVNYIYQEYI